ncbi:protein NRT1/ PTR FAMILY 1.2-like [Diospyros lotus]|uniref:protein NRT1/ PTR FAMILY 1.2-like n=1 Tax=Diospyros lotus TaxID=55363 RepID=UPI00225BF2D5|nr:protein NRT1/ PTR FAMILY 1.2-like [Diospyros lotus]
MEVSSDAVKKTTEEEVPKTKGGLRTMPFVIANEALEKVAAVGLFANMILYLRNEYHLSTVTSINILFVWNAVSSFLPIFGAFFSDSYLGRFKVIGIGTIITLLGLIVLFLTAILKSARPPHCDNIFLDKCVVANSSHLAFLFSAFVLMSIGAGGIRPCSLAFGADQFDRPENPKNERVLQSFFNWYYASVGISVMISITVIIYIQNQFGWVVGFGVPVGLMLFSTAMFFLGSPLYFKVKAKKSLVTGLAQAACAAVKKRRQALQEKVSDGRYHHEKGSKLVEPSEKLRCLNKACMIVSPEKDLKPNGRAMDPWSLCTVEQVEELKALIRVVPIWSTGIMNAVTISQQSFPVLQALSMDRRFIKNFKIPPGSFAVFSLLTLTIWVAIYDTLIVPWISGYTKRPRGLSLKQRMGIGLFFSCIAMALSAEVERIRRGRAISDGLAAQPLAVVNMSAMWLVPQYCVGGLAEAFNIIGQIEFYYSQFPKKMASVGVALFSLGMGAGNLVGSLILTVIHRASKRNGAVSWVSSNINMGHYDYYYWVLATLSVANLLYFFFCCWLYGSEDQRSWVDDKISEEGEQGA